MEDLTGISLGKYQITGPLGEGGMAAVYKAYQPDMERYVALKILPRHLADDPRFTQRFRQEAKIIAKLQHPHILPVYDFGEAHGYTYLVMPFVETGTLADLQTHQPFPLGEIRQIISQVGEALDYAHAQGVVHRDVKPSNILIDEWGNCLLTDFGIGKILSDSNQLTRTGEMVGTPAYISPEQGLGNEIDGRSDIYSLGVIFYELATGRPPYNAETPMAIVIKHIYDPLPPPRKVNPALPEAIEGVILKSLAKDRNHRFDTAGDMVKAVRAAIEPAATEEIGVRPSIQIARSPQKTGHSAPPLAPKPRSPGPSQKPTNKGIKPVWLWLGGGSFAFAAMVLLTGIAAFGIRWFSGPDTQAALPSSEADLSLPAKPLPTFIPGKDASTFNAEGLEILSPALIWSKNPERVESFQGEIVPDPQGVFGQAARLYVQGYGHGEQTAWITVRLEVPAQADIIVIPAATSLNGAVDKTDSEAGLEIQVRDSGGQESWTYASFLMETKLGIPYAYAFADVSPFRGQPVTLTIALRQPDICAGAQCTYDAEAFFGDLYFGRLPDICTVRFDDTRILYDYYSDPTPQEGSTCDDPQSFYFIDIQEGPHNAYGKGQNTFEIPFALPENAEIIEFRLYYGTAAEALTLNNHTFLPEEIYRAFPVRSGIYLNIPEPARYALFNNNPGMIEHDFNWGTNHLSMTISTAESWEERPFDLFMRFRVPTK